MPERIKDSSTRADVRRIPLLEKLSGEEQDDLAALSSPRRFSKGDVVFTEGDPGDGFHIVIEGRIKVYKLSVQGKEQILHVWGPGEMLGEVAALQGIRLPAHAAALEASRTLFLPRAGLLALIAKNPDFALRFMAVLARRLRSLADLVEALSLQEVPSRLATYLLLLDSRQGNRGRIEWDLPKADIARLLGTIPETISRTLGRWTRKRSQRGTGPGRCGSWIGTGSGNWP